MEKDKISQGKTGQNASKPKGQNGKNTQKGQQGQNAKTGQNAGRKTPAAKNTQTAAKKSPTAAKMPPVAAKILPSREKGAYWEKVSLGFSALMLAIFPLMPGTEGYFNITESKYLYFRVFTVIYLALCAIIFLYVFCSSKELALRRAEGLQKLTLPQIFVLAYLVWGVISAIASPYSGSDIWTGQSRYEGLYSMLLYGGIFFCLSFWSEYDAKPVYGLALAAMVMGLIGIFQIFRSTVMFPEGYDYYNSGFLATLGNKDCFSGVAAFSVPVLVCAFCILDSKFRWLCLPGAMMMFYVQLAADVDSGKLGLVAAFVVTLPYLVDSRKKLSRALISWAALALCYAAYKIFPNYVYREPDKVFWFTVIAAAVLAVAGLVLALIKRDFKLNPKYIRRGLAALIIIAVVAGVIVVYLYSGTNKLILEASGFLHGELPDRAGSGRGFIWKHSMELVWKHPIVGSGPGTFFSSFSVYNSAYQELSPNTVVDFAHNDFIQIAVCVGIVGLALYVAFLVSLAVRALKAAKYSPLVVIFAAGVVGYVVHSFFAFSIAIVTPLFWVCAGMLDKCIRQVMIKYNK
jgi:hypothetical protein